MDELKPEIKVKTKIKLIRIPLKTGVRDVIPVKTGVRDVIPAMGPPTKMTDLTVKKLEEAFSIGATILEACIYADISRQTYYDWIKANPNLSDRFEQLREKPILKARDNIAKAIAAGDADTSKWYLERKKKDEFSTRSELTGKGGQGIKINVVDYDGKQRDSNTSPLRSGHATISVEDPAKPGEIQVVEDSPESGENGAVDQQDQPSGT